MKIMKFDMIANEIAIVCLVTENRGENYLKIRDLLSIALFNILGTHYLIHI
jgi:hypothetical protein